MGAIAPAVSLAREERACEVLRAEEREPSKRRNRDSVWRVDAMNAADAWAIALLMPRPPKETGRHARSQVGSSIENGAPMQLERARHWPSSKGM